jgi:hypothetical protein
MRKTSTLKKSRASGGDPGLIRTGGLRFRKPGRDTPEDAGSREKTQHASGVARAHEKSLRALARVGLTDAELAGAFALPAAKVRQLVGARRPPQRIDTPAAARMVARAARLAGGRR